MGFNKKIILSEPVHFDLYGCNRIEWSGTQNLKKQLRPVVEEFARSFGL